MNNLLSTNINDLEGEIWEYILDYGYEYQISNMGRVKSFKKGPPRILRKTISDGKFKVLLYDGRGRFVNYSIGVLVATYFDRKPNEDEVLKYRDGNSLNDKRENVYWTTRQNSVRQTILKKGTYNKGLNNGMTKLTEEKVREIKDLRRSGKSYKDLSDIFGVGISNVQSIVNGRTWKAVI